MLLEYPALCLCVRVDGKEGEAFPDDLGEG